MEGNLVWITIGWLFTNPQEEQPPKKAFSETVLSQGPWMPSSGGGSPRGYADTTSHLCLRQGAGKQGHSNNANRWVAEFPQKGNE